MARTVLTLVLIIFLNLMVGCRAINTGASQRVPESARKPVPIVKAGETDIIEEMVNNRDAYYQGLRRLVNHYTETGNNLKFSWAQKELSALEAVPQYNYVIEATLTGPNLKPTTDIPEADELYDEAVQIEQKARKLKVVVNEDLLRVALNKYNRLIKKHPASTKIPDAAYKAAGIYEHFKDYSVAVLYYNRVYQWDPETSYPAMYKSAYILDRYLHRREDALALYQKAVSSSDPYEHVKWRDYAIKRISKLTGAAPQQPQE